MRAECVERATRFAARFLDETRREEGTAATQRAATHRVWADDTITGPQQNALGRARVFRLEIAVEGVYQQNDLGPGAGRSSAIGVSGPFGQFAGGAEPKEPLPEAGEKRNPVSQVHQWRDARGIRSIARQIGDQPIADPEPVTASVMVQKLDFHSRHVDAGGAFALAAFARYAQRHRLTHVFGNERVGLELTGQRQPQCVGAAAGQMLFVAGGSVRGAHYPRIRFAAGG